jgi:hypothetical protein
MVVVVGSTATVLILGTGDEVVTSGGSANPLSAFAPGPAAPGGGDQFALARATRHPFGDDAAVDSGTRYDFGAEENGVVAAIGSRPTVAAPDESRIVAAIGSGGEARTAARPGEAAVSAAIAGCWRGSAAARLDGSRLALKG